MSFINPHTKEINCKIVYYGPEGGGKSTNLQCIYKKTNPEAKSKMVTLSSENEATMFFDFLPLALGEIKGFKTRFHLYTIPGPKIFGPSKRLILKGVDGVVFVADSQVDKTEANLESLEDLTINLREQGVSYEDVPLVIQYNKRDLPAVSSMNELQKILNPNNLAPDFEAVATKGEGVFETFKAIAKAVINIKKKDFE